MFYKKKKITKIWANLRIHKTNEYPEILTTLAPGKSRLNDAVSCTHGLYIYDSDILLKNKLTLSFLYLSKRIRRIFTNTNNTVL